MSKPKRKNGEKFVGTYLTDAEHGAMRALASKGMRSLAQELRIAIRKHAGLEKAG